MPVVLNAMIEQVSLAAAGASLLAHAHAADKETAAEAAMEAAFPTTTSTDAEHGHESLVPAAQPQGKKIIYEGDVVAATAAGIVTGSFLHSSWVSSLLLLLPGSFPVKCIGHLTGQCVGNNGRPASLCICIIC